MGLFKKKFKDGFRGTAYVASASGPPRSGGSSNCSMDLVVQVPGTPAYTVDYHEWVVSTKVWPSPGQTLPVVVHADDPQRLKVLWDEVPTHDERGRAAAEQMAQMLRMQQPGMAPPGFGPPGSPQGAAGAAGMPEVVAQLQQLFPGATIDAGGGPPPVGAPPVVIASQSGADPVARLEKLAALRANGVIDEAQFQQLRQQILGQAGLG